MSKVGKSYIPTLSLRQGSASEVSGAFVTLTDPVTTEDFNVLSSDLSSVSFRSITISDSILSTDSIIEAIGSITLTLPTAVGVSSKEYTFKNAGFGQVVVNPNGSESIDGELLITLSRFEAIKIISNGSNWLIL